MPFLQQVTSAPTFLGRLAVGKPDACCTPVKPLQAAAPVIARRSKLSDLDDHVHCSIIGTCLTTGELRKLVPHYDLAIDRKSSSDLEIHHAALNLSTKSEVAAKELTKALDTRHAATIKRFKAAANEAELAELWRAAMVSGDVPGAYWALMTHPQSTYKLRSVAFGDVHMLSHLIGASNRADVRRLATLEDEHAQLRIQIAGQQRRLGELGAKHHQAVTLAQDRSAQLHNLQERLAALQSEDAVHELGQARAALATQREQIEVLTQRCQDADGRLLARVQALEAVQTEYADHETELAAARVEISLLEQALTQVVAPDTVAPALPALNGMVIGYVGGRQQSTLILARMVADAGGELLVHDGGLEDRKGLLASTLARAQLVVYPVDCVSHNAMYMTKQIAARSGIPYYPLRKASLANFTELMHRIVVQA